MECLFVKGYIVFFKENLLMKKKDKHFIPDYERELLITRCASLYYIGNMVQEDIAKSMGISRQLVSRLLDEGKRNGLIKFRIELTKLENLAMSLVRKFGLIDSHVFFSTKDIYENQITTNELLGHNATPIIDKILMNCENSSKVGFGGGRTVFTIIKNLRGPFEGKDLNIYPLCSGAYSRAKKYIDGDKKRFVNGRYIGSLFFGTEAASFFTGRFWKTTFPVRIAVPPFSGETVDEIIKEKKELLEKYEELKEIYEELQGLDIVIASVDKLRDERNYVNVAKKLGLSYNTLTKKMNVISDLARNAFDKEGNSVKGVIEDYGLSLQYDSIKEIAANPHKKMILIVGGEDKYEPIKAILKGKLANILITDSITAEELLKEPDF